MPQSRKGSIIETTSSTVLGIVLTQFAILPMFGIALPMAADLAMGFIFAIIGITRAYLFRRYFNSRKEFEE